MSTNSASRTASRDELAALLRQTGMNHHQAFIETNGADPEWPLWYAEYLEGTIDRFVGASPTRSKIVQCLLNASDAHMTGDPNAPWPSFYADFLLGLDGADVVTPDSPSEN